MLIHFGHTTYYLQSFTLVDSFSQSFTAWLELAPVKALLLQVRGLQVHGQGGGLPAGTTRSWRPSGRGGATNALQEHGGG